ncbi:MAG: ACT domain-containing protein [Candidatus ainarchaeum sp.]|nr:ACT domain-containing protein [Candidatus ainarchaeum sp.]MDD5096695.1 ACT domain-containing protein [Candidatus ainarchaeum sp.]
MKEISIITEDRVGLLADVSYVLGKARINIESISASGVGGKAVLSIVVKDYEKAKQVLENSGFKVTNGNVVFIKLADQPGKLAEIAKMLADNKINVENLHLVSRDGKSTIVGITVSNPKKAKDLLKDVLIDKES